MCLDAMETDGSKQHLSRPGWRRRRRSGYAAVQKATLRKHVGRSPRKPGRRSRVPARPSAFTPGAMAPMNTTQYLMELVYRDLGDEATAASPTRPSASAWLPHKHAYSYTEDTMDFQNRDFESVFFLNEL